MNTVVKSITVNSPASKVPIRQGDILKRINGNLIADVLDYKFYSYDRHLFLELQSTDKRMKLIRLNKREGEDLGLEFDDFLMDKQRSCVNKCIFCFIDQLPQGLRNTLYYKDDDVRLSFLQGNYVTLTNLTEKEIQRIIKLRVSPINISVHTLNKKLRRYMLGNKNAGNILPALQAFAGAGLTMNCQIVCCPGINDGSDLLNTMRVLYELSPYVKSVSVVPVGLTRFRQTLESLQPFSKNSALDVTSLVGEFGEFALSKSGSRVFYCADEFFIKAGLPIPGKEYYEDYPQLENGVGMLRLLMSEFHSEMARTTNTRRISSSFSVATGIAAEKYISKLLKVATEKYSGIDGTVYTIENQFFGNMITVSGLITGGDISNQLKGRKLGDRLLIPRNMLKSGTELFLDDYTVTRLSDEIGVSIRIVETNGADLLHAFLGE